QESTFFFCFFGSSHSSRSAGAGSPGAATQALGFTVGRDMPFTTLVASNTFIPVLIFIGWLWPIIRRCGHQHSQVSMPIPSGGDWVLLVATDLLNLFSTDTIPVTRIKLVRTATCSFRIKQTNR